MECLQLHQQLGVNELSPKITSVLMKAWMEHTDEKDSDCLWLQAELEERLFFTFNLTIFLERAVNFCKLHSCSCLQPGTCSGVQDFILSWSTSVCAQEGKKKLSCRVRPLVCFLCTHVFLTKSARQQKCTCYMDV